MPKPPDDSERAAAGTLPDDPEADTEPMPAPGLPPKLETLLAPAFARMRRRHTGEERPIPLPWPTLATPLGGGLWPGLHVLVGNTAAGKTQWCLQVALEAAKADTPVLYVALEASDVEFVARCLGLVAGTAWNRLYHGNHEGLEVLIDKHVHALKRLPLYVRLAPPHGWHAAALPGAVYAIRETYREAMPGDRPLLVILDFLQIIGAEKGQREELRERIGKAAYVGRGVAREYNAAVLLASSTARENYLALTGRRRGKSSVEQDKDNQLGKGWAGRFVGLGKESGEIEHAADTVIVLTQEPWGEEDDTPPRGGTTCHLALAKVRAGTPAWVQLRFDGRAFTEPTAAAQGEILNI
jgi:replicative DNA helicase